MISYDPPIDFDAVKAMTPAQLLKDVSDLERQYWAQYNELQQLQALAPSIAGGSYAHFSIESGKVPLRYDDEGRSHLALYRKMPEKERLAWVEGPKDAFKAAQNIHARIAALETNLESLVQQIGNIIEVDVRSMPIKHPQMPMEDLDATL